MKLRRALVVWHRWFGVAAALWLTLLALTGSIIVFYDELDTALNPDLRRASSQGAPLPAGDLVAAAEAAYPGARASFIDLANSSGETARIFLSGEAGAQGAGDADIYVFVDPATAEVLGERRLGAISLHRRHVMDFIYELHLDLLLGGWMVWFLGLVSFLWIFDHIAGAALSFPAPKRWAASFRIRRGARGHKLNFDLHRAVGLWLLPVTLMLAVSGVYFNWMGPFVHVVEEFSPLTPRASFEAPELPAPLYDPPVGLDAALAIARETAGGAEVDIVSVNAAKGLYEARVFDPRDVDPYGRRLIAIDARSGEVIGDRHQARGSAGDVFVAWQYPLHSGKAFGWPGRILVFLSGIAVAALSVTGILIWLRKLRARRRAASA